MTNMKVIKRCVALLVAAVGVGLAPAGCVTTVSQTCDGGLLCPENTRCDDVNHRCISATEEAACAGLDEGETCTLLGAKGTCRARICQPHFCGDSMVSDLEQCDGAPAQGLQSCLISGFDRGFAGCTESCQASTDGCETMGWQAEGILLGCSCGCDFEPATMPYQAIWGSGSDVWAAGERVVHWDGTTWSYQSPPGMEAGWSGVWAAGPHDAWAAGFDNGIVHWNGNAWESSTGLELSSREFPPRLWGTGARDVYAFGGSLLKHWDGSQWSDMRPAQDSSLVFFSMTGSGPEDVFVLDQATVWHFDGKTWGAATIGDDHISAIWARSAEVGYALGAKALYKRDGASWTPIPGAAGGLPLNGGGDQIWGSGPDNVFVVRRKADDGTDSSTVSHWNGVAWTTFYDGHASGVWGDGRGTIFVVGSEGLLSPRAGTWLPALSVEAQAMWGVGEDIFTVARLEPPDVTAGRDPVSGRPVIQDGGPPVGQAGYATDRSTSFTLLPPIPLQSPVFRSMWASASNDIWVSARDEVSHPNESYVWHWDGTNWSPSTTITGTTVTPEVRPPITYPAALGGSGPSDIWAVGDFGTTHWDGHTWSIPEPTAVPYAAVWAASSKDAYEVGAAGSIRHWDGKAWTEMTSGTTADLYDVWGSGPDDVYAVGGMALGLPGGTTLTTLHLDAGRQWSPLWPPMNFVQVRGSSSGNVFATDGFGLYHRRAGAWEPIRTPLNQVKSLWVTPRSVYVSDDSVPLPGVGHIAGRSGGPLNGIQRLDLVGVTCQSPETNCTDGWDNDCDGLQDGADPDCAGTATTELCANLSDDDYDGLADCDDPDCVAFPNCAD
jgi:hypothetical protein